MNSHLQYISKEYEGKQVQGCWPISSADCEVITTLSKILEIKGEHRIVRILNNWKKVADTDTIDALNQVFDIASYRQGKDNDFEDEGEDGEVLNVKSQFEGPTFIQIKDYIVKVRYLKNIAKEDSYDNKGSVYYIIVNKDIPYEEQRIKYRSLESRDYALTILKGKLIDYENCKFI